MIHMLIIEYFKKAYRYLQYYLNPYIVLNSSLVIKNGKVINFNLGDDLNIPLLENIVERKIKIKQQCKIGKVKKILCIGSIIESHCDKYSLIWGSGAMHGNIPLLEKPSAVYAVRGPLTRDYLLQQGVECPPIYGDPALLLPIIYAPNIEKKHKIGFIPHFIDYDIPHVKKFREEHPDIKFIKFQGYKSWQDVINQILSCEKIISSSLHGLIISDAYGIPNIRVVFSDNILGGDFKYKDYFGGVKRAYYPPIDFRTEIDLSLAHELFENYSPINYDIKILLDSFPYKLKKEYEL